MDTNYKKQLSELVALYTLEPTLKDVYVEGVSDRNFLSWYMDRLGCSGAEFHDIDSVDIPIERLHPLGLSGGNKSRVICLAKCLESEVEHELAHVSCVIDRDFDDLLGSPHIGKYLLVTDHSNLDAYLWNYPVFEKFFRLAGINKTEITHNLFESISKIFKFSFAMRAANQALSWSMSWVSFKQTLKVAGLIPVLDENKFLTKYLSKNAKIAHRDEFVRKLRTIDESLETSRIWLHKDDMYELLGWYFVKRLGQKSSGVSNKDVFRRISPPAIETELIEDEEMLAELTRRIGCTTQS